MAHATARLTMSPESFLTLLVLGLLVALGALALADEFRQRRIQGNRTPDHIFRCEHCNLIYTDDPGVDRSRCPQCGRTNEVFEF